MAGGFGYNGVVLNWFGHSSFLLEHGNETVYIDNYIVPDKFEKIANVIVHTHGHFDHCVENPRLVDKDTVYLGMCKHAHNLIGNKLKIRGMGFEFVEAYNMGKPFHPKGFGCGVIITINGVRIYHAGDSDLIPEMDQYKCDIALLPIGGNYTMNEKDAVAAVGLINPKIVIPMHYGSVPNTRADAYYFKKLVEEKEPRTKVVLLD